MKIVKNIFFVFLIALSINALDAMERQQINLVYPESWCKEPSLQNLICYSYAAAMASNNDMHKFKELHDGLQERIVAIYNLIHGNQKASFFDLLDCQILIFDIAQQRDCNLDYYIRKMIMSGHYANLQSALDILNHHAALSVAIEAHQVLAAYVKKLDQQQMFVLFNQLFEESALKMALRLVSAKKYKENLDDLDCVKFIVNIKRWVNPINYNYWNFEANPVLSQKYLYHVIPLLESIIEGPVIKLDLTGNYLKSVPDVVRQLVYLKGISFENSAKVSDKLLEAKRDKGLEFYRVSHGS